MAVYQIRVNEKIAVGKSLVAFLQSIPQVVTFEKPTAKTTSKSELYEGLGNAFADVRLMMDGKKKKKTVEEFLDELRNSND